MIRHPARFIMISLLVAWMFDFLFWKKPLGISFLVWTLILLIGGVLLARSEGVRIARQSYVLMVGIVLLAAGVFLRAEPFTQAVSLLLAVTLIFVAAATFLNGYWVRFRIVDYIVAGFHAFVASFTRPFDLSRRAPGDAENDNGDNHITDDPDHAAISNSGTVQDKPWRSALRRLLPYLRGLVLALPVLLILGGLLVAADPIFSGWVEGWIKIFDIDHLVEYAVRFIFILLLAFLFTGVYLYAIKPKSTPEKPDPQKPLFNGFLGWTESAVVLVSVNLLFAVFLLVQFRYFFGGAANITEAGYTFSEYARRGFGELVAVAVLSLLLYLGLGLVTRLKNKPARTGFTMLSVLLIMQVMVMLVSAFQRLLLYEDAYGFTRLRMHAHVFMVWLGVLLAAVLVFEVLRRRGWFTLALLATVFGFTLSLVLLNVDGQVVRRNAARAGLTELDVEYLKTLSNDAVPVMADLFAGPLDQQVKDVLGMQLACRKAILDQDSRPWQGFTWSEASARRTLDGMESALADYPVMDQDGLWMVNLNGQQENCSQMGSNFD